MEKRPILNNKILVKDFREFYWLKKELQDFCKRAGLKRNGSKIEIYNRIKYYLETGKVLKEKNKRIEPLSNFNWKTERLSLETVIRDNYKNSENVRNFFIEKIGKSFKFNVKFMNWMKSNNGQTLNDAIEEWKRIEQEKKMNKTPKEIEPQFEFNRYLRDFLADNPSKDRKIGIKLWNLKKSMRGNNEYKKSDLNLVEK